MKFFFPLTTDAEQAERIYQRIAGRLIEAGFKLSTERFYKIIFLHKGELKSETIGESSTNGEIVLAIFKNEVGYFVCTYSTGAVWGEPTVANYFTVESVEEFD